MGTVEVLASFWPSAAIGLSARCVRGYPRSVHRPRVSTPPFWHMWQRVSTPPSRPRDTSYAKKSRFLKPAVRKRENARARVSHTTSASFFVLASMRGTA